ncbi:MAG: hypothetical protein SVX43_11710 [Cyanobacteriota bacterium]|nr:hypothetical protein [Cyanobacteriota bacterium]
MGWVATIFEMKQVPGCYPIVLVPDVLKPFVGNSLPSVGLETALQGPPVPPRIPWLLEVARGARAHRGRLHWLGGATLVFVSLLGLGGLALWRLGLLLPASIALLLIAVGLLLLGWGLKEMLAIAEASYQRSIAAYEQKMREYRTKSHSSSRGSPRRRLKGQSRLEALQQALEGKVQFPKASSSAQRGVSETFFFEYLKDAFGEVHFGHELEIEGYDYNYSTDFTLAIAGLYLDIEIDECYAGKGKKFVPTHCIDDDKDRRRDRFFLERGWIVVRFAEEQVVRHPKSCCQAIAQVLGELTGDCPTIDRGKGESELPLVRQWSKVDARRRYKSNFRKRLLAEIGVYFGAK